MPHPEGRVNGSSDKLRCRSSSVQMGDSCAPLRQITEDGSSHIGILSMILGSSVLAWVVFVVKLLSGQRIRDFVPARLPCPRGRLGRCVRRGLGRGLGECDAPDSRHAGREAVAQPGLSARELASPPAVPQPGALAVAVRAPGETPVAAGLACLHGAWEHSPTASRLGLVRPIHIAAWQIEEPGSSQRRPDWPK